jgi:hypothetical protein
MWDRRKRESELEEALRSLQAKASPELVGDVAARILAHSTPARRPWPRITFAAATATFVLGTFASFGGLSYAAPGANATVAAVKQVVAGHPLKVTVHKSSAMSQYPPPPPSTPANTFTPPKHHHVLAQTTTPAHVSAGQTLPFTGMSLLGTLLASVALVGMGLLLRRRERRS